MSHTNSRRSEKDGIFHFLQEMGSALIMALIAIVYVIQAFKIPTGSMENSLLVGDFLLGLKFVYGAPVVPFSQELGISQRFPSVTKPKVGDVIIFKYPGSDKKDYIKRCVTGPGSVIEIHDTILIVDGKKAILPPHGKYVQKGQIPRYYQPDTRITNFKPLKIPAQGDIIKPSELDTREFLFLKHLVHQENPKAKVTAQYQLYINGEFSNDRKFTAGNMQLSLSDLQTGKLSSVNENNGRPEPYFLNNEDDWTRLDDNLNFAKNYFAAENPEIKQILFVNDKPITEYKVKYDNFFMVGDNRDNSKDSRYWGYLNYNFIKAKAFILYFSLDSNTPWWQLPLKIRWDRIGRLIRPWDGLNIPKYYK